VSPVFEREIQERRSYVGSVIAPRSVLVGSAVAARLERIHVEEGDRVEAGEIIAELERDVIEAQLQAARAELERRKQQLAELEAGPRPQELEAALARVEAARLGLELARRRQRRVQSLYDRGAARDEELDDASTAVDQAAQRLRQAEAEYELLRAGARPEAIAQARAAVAAQQALVEQYAREYEKHLVRAPFTGYVVRRYTDKGAWVTQGGPIVELVELDVVDIEVPVPEDDVARLRYDAAARVTIDALRGRAFTSSDIRVVPRAIPGTRTFPVRIRLKNEFDPHKRPLIKVGFFAQAELPLGERFVATLIPKDALVPGRATPTVFVLAGRAAPGATAKVRAVRLDVLLGWRQCVAVRGNVQPGELVVVEGNERLVDGQEVRVLDLVPTEKFVNPETDKAIVEPPTARDD